MSQGFFIKRYTEIKKTILILFITFSLSSIGNTYVVTKTTDLHTPPPTGSSQYTYLNTPGELRWAIYQANQNPGKDIIQFDIPNSGNVFPQIIKFSPTGVMITGAIEIDGNSQQAGTPGQQAFVAYTGNEAKIRIVSTSIGSTNGFPGGPPSYAVGLLPFYFKDSGTSGSKIQNLSFTNDPTGMPGSPSLGLGISFFHSSNNLVKNCVFKDLQDGIVITGDSKSNLIVSNYFGTDKSLSVFANTMSNGVEIHGNYDGAGNMVYPENNIIGGGNNADRNYFYNMKVDISACGVVVSSGNKNKILNNIYIDNRKNIRLNYPTCVVGTPASSNICKAPPTISSAGISGNTVTINGTCLNGDKVEVYKTNSTNIDAVQLVGTVNATSTNWTLTLTNSSLVLGDKFVATCTDAQGNTSEFCTQPMQISGCNTCSSIDFSWYGTLCPNKPVAFVPTTLGCNFNNASAWLWDYGDGTPPTTNNVHTFATTGNFNVKYYVPASGNCAEIKKIKTVPITACPPVAGCAKCTDFDFFFPNRICVGEKIKFEKFLNCDVSYTPSWDFGDGTIITSNSEHTFTLAGSYTVTMSIPGCTKSKIITVIDCPELSCNPNFPCATLGLNVNIVLVSSNISTGVFVYQANPSTTISPPYTGGYSYTWSYSTDPNVTYSINNNQLTVTKGANAGNITISVVVTATGNGCTVSKTIDPCSGFGASVSQVSFGIPNASYKAVVTPISPAASSYSFLWSLEPPVPSNAVITSPGVNGGPCTGIGFTCNQVNIAGIQNNPNTQNGVELKLKVQIAETSNGSNGCKVTLYKDDQPCAAFQPTIVLDPNQSGLQPKQYRYKIATPIPGGSGSYTYQWTIDFIASGHTAQVIGNSNTNSFVIQYDATYDPNDPYCVKFSSLVTDTAGKRCSKKAESGCL